MCTAANYWVDFGVQNHEVKRFFHFIIFHFFTVIERHTVKFHISLFPKRVVPTPRFPSHTVTTGHPNVVRFSLKGNNPSDIHLPAAKTFLHIGILGVGCIFTIMKVARETLPPLIQGSHRLEIPTSGILVQLTKQRNCQGSNQYIQPMPALKLEAEA